MKIKKIIIQGEFLEAYLYFDFLWLIQRDGTVFAFDIEKFCKNELNGSGNAASHLFADNKRLTSSHHMRNDGRELRHLLASKSAIEVSWDILLKYSYVLPTAMKIKSVLDLKFYYGRAYLGLDSGITQFGVMGRDELSEVPLGKSAHNIISSELVSDMQGRQFQCRFGAVAVACGKSGGYIGVGAINEDYKWRVEFEQFAPESFGVELNGEAISNLLSNNRVEFYASTTNKAVTSPIERDEDLRLRLEITGAKEISHADLSENVNRIISIKYPMARPFLFKSAVWLMTETSFVRLKFTEYDAVNHDDKFLNNPKEWPAAKNLPGRVLSTSSTELGIIAECDDDAYILHEKEWQKIISDSVYSIRGYPHSRRYKKVATAVALDRVEMMAIVDPSKFAC